jgi:hypothetical protein
MAALGHTVKPYGSHFLVDAIMTERTMFQTPNKQRFISHLSDISVYIAACVVADWVVNKLTETIF